MSERIRVSKLTIVGFLVAIGFTIALIAINRPGVINDSNNLSESHRMIKVGGLAEVREKDDEVVEVVDKIKPIFEDKTNTQYASIEVLSYSPQTVAGKNYFVKVQTKTVDGNEGFAHLRIYRNLKGEVELTSYQLDKKKEDQLVHFQ